MINLASKAVPHPAVEVTGVSKSFGRGRARRDVLSEIDLRVAPGEFVSVLGPSGSGKSTLLSLISGNLEPDAGSVQIAGAPVQVAREQKQIGLVPQTSALLPWRTVRDNVRLALQVNSNASRRRGRGAAASPERKIGDVEGLLRSFGLGGDLDKYPHQLSVGMRQRVNIARAFSFNPTLLLMDEPFSALDEINREQQQLGLHDFWQEHQKSVLFVTHSVREALLLSDRVLLLGGSPGQIVENLEIDIPRPRLQATNETASFRELESYVRSRLREILLAGIGDFPDTGRRRP